MIQIFRVYAGGRLECYCPDSYLANDVIEPNCPKHVLGQTPLAPGGELRLPRPEEMW